MAFFEIDIFKKSIIVDLHEYSQKTAVMTAKEKIKEAYEHGFRYIKLIHGAAGIKNKTDGGNIKFALRSMLKNRELDKWVEVKDSKEHKINEVSLTLKLRSNPEPVEKEWMEMQLEEY